MSCFICLNYKEWSQILYILFDVKNENDSITNTLIIYFFGTVAINCTNKIKLAKYSFVGESELDLVFLSVFSELLQQDIIEVKFLGFLRAGNSPKDGLHFLQCPSLLELGKELHALTNIWLNVQEVIVDVFLILYLDEIVILAGEEILFVLGILF